MVITIETRMYRYIKVLLDYYAQMKSLSLCYSHLSLTSLINICTFLLSLYLSLLLLHLCNEDNPLLSSPIFITSYNRLVHYSPITHYWYLSSTFLLLPIIILSIILSHITPSTVVGYPSFSLTIRTVSSITITLLLFSLLTSNHFLSHPLLSPVSPHYYCSCSLPLAPTFIVPHSNLLPLFSITLSVILLLFNLLTNNLNVAIYYFHIPVILVLFLHPSCTTLV